MYSRSLFGLFASLFLVVVLLAGVIMYKEFISNDTISTSTTPQIIAYPTRTPTEKEILEDPSKISLEKIVSLAQDTDVLHIIDCTPTPFVIRMKYGRSYTIRNNSLQDHTLSINGETNHTIEAQSEKTIKADFGQPGVYGYGCDTSGNAVGFIVISES